MMLPFKTDVDNSFSFSFNSFSTSSKYSLEIPKDTTPNLPSLPQQGELVHFGDSSDIDFMTLSPSVWKSMVTDIGVKTLLDIGCGRGASTAWFITHTVQSLCVEGSQQAIQTTLLPDPSQHLIEHDYTLGPWWPQSTQDAVWCVDFLEHVGRHFHHNLLPTFRKSAIIFMTHAVKGGLHHVEVHPATWWIHKMQMYGFRYSEDWTQALRAIAKREGKAKIPSMMNGKTYDAQHLYKNTGLLVFINPAVTALPEHAHLMAEHGCYQSTGKEGPLKTKHKKCGIGHGGFKETPLDKEFLAIELTPSMDKEWEILMSKTLSN